MSQSEKNLDKACRNIEISIALIKWGILPLLGITIIHAIYRLFHG